MNKYAERDHEALEPEYLEHLSAMTGEKLRSKSAIAAELAWRDREIKRLTAELEAKAVSVGKVAASRWVYPGGEKSPWHDGKFDEDIIAVALENNRSVEFAYAAPPAPAVDKGLTWAIGRFEAIKEITEYAPSIRAIETIATNAIDRLRAQQQD